MDRQVTHVQAAPRPGVMQRQFQTRFLGQSDHADPRRSAYRHFQT